MNDERNLEAELLTELLCTLAGELNCGPNAYEIRAAIAKLKAASAPLPPAHLPDSHRAAWEQGRAQKVEQALVELIQWLDDDTLEIMKDTIKMGITFDQTDCTLLREQIEKARAVLDAEYPVPSAAPALENETPISCTLCGAPMRCSSRCTENPTSDPPSATSTKEPHNDKA